MTKLTDRLHGKLGVANADITTARDTPWYPLKDVGQVMALAQSAAIADTKKLVVQFRQATSAAGGSAKNLGEAIEAVASGSQALAIFASKYASELDHNNGFTHVSARVSSDNATGVAGSVVLLVGESAYNPA